jgi:7-cyano-7-deazaguanine synthase in queuosine biosynthesis
MIELCIWRLVDWTPNCRPSHGTVMQRLLSFAKGRHVEVGLRLFDYRSRLFVRAQPPAKCGLSQFSPAWIYRQNWKWICGECRREIPRDHMNLLIPQTPPAYRSQ